MQITEETRARLVDFLDKVSENDERTVYRGEPWAGRSEALSLLRVLDEAFKAPEVGELGLPFTVAGSVAQALGQQVIERDNATEEEVVAFFRTTAENQPLPFGEDAIWDQLGPIVDEIEDAVLANVGKRIIDGQVVPA